MIWVFFYLATLFLLQRLNPHHYTILRYSSATLVFSSAEQFSSPLLPPKNSFYRLSSAARTEMAAMVSILIRAARVTASLPQMRGFATRETKEGFPKPPKSQAEREYYNKRLKEIEEAGKRDAEDAEKERLTASRLAKQRLVAHRKGLRRLSRQAAKAAKEAAKENMTDDPDEDEA